MLSHLIRRSRLLLLSAGAGSIVSGVCGVLLISLINAALTSGAGERDALAWRFAATALAVMFSWMLANILFLRLGEQAQANLRGYVAARVNAADFRRLEEAGGARVQSALGEHSATVAEFFANFPVLLTNAIIVLGCLVYMLVLSWQVFLFAVLVIGLGSLGYHLAHLSAIRHLETAAQEQDRLYGYFRSLFDGAKELRLNRRKRQVFGDEVLGASVETVRAERTRGMSIFIASASWGHFLIYAFIGLVLFVLVGDTPDRSRVVLGYALIFMYMVAPLEILLVNIPRANLARAAMRRINELVGDLPGGAPEAPAKPAALRSLKLAGVVHRYYHERSEEFFELGPIDLEFRAGEICFLVGGNGSGKTTLAKLLVGLYAPERGEVIVDGKPVGDSGRDAYRQYFSAVFSDFHLFDRLLESGHADLDAEGNRLLQHLQLEHKVQVRDGAFTTLALSQGQRKRLALVSAYLEDRPFVVFDEWAADQDPVFKEVFYRQLLPELRALGKTVLVISHDDRYFHLGDRVIRMENGRVMAADAASDNYLVAAARLSGCRERRPG